MYLKHVMDKKEGSLKHDPSCIFWLSMDTKVVQIRHRGPPKCPLCKGWKGTYRLTILEMALEVQRPNLFNICWGRYNLD